MRLETVFVLGSSRPRGNTRLLVDHVNHTHAAPIVDLGTFSIGVYDYLHANQNDDFIGVIESLVSFRNIVFATPVYWYAMSAQMKTFFDRLTDLITIRNDLGKALAKHDCAVIASGTSTEPPAGFFEPFHNTAQYFDMRYLGSYYGYFEEDLILDPDATEDAEKFARLIFRRQRDSVITTME